MKNKERTAHGREPTGQRLTTRCNVVLPENKSFHHIEALQDEIAERIERNHERAGSK